MMEAQRKMEISVGITVVLAIVITLLVILWGKGIILGQKTREYTFKFSQVGGLSQGDIVRLSGVEVGRVTDVNLQGDSVLVRVRIDSKIKMKRDAKAVLSSAELMGSKMVEVHTGKSPQLANSDVILEGQYIPGLTEIAGMFQNRQDDFDKMLTNIMEIVSSIRVTLGDTGSTGLNLRSVIRDVASTTSHVDSLVDGNMKIIQETISNLQQSSATLQAFISSEQSRAKNILHSGENLVAQLQTVSDTAQKLLDHLNGPHSSIGRLVKSDTLYLQFQETLTNLNLLISDFKEHPEKYFENVKFKVSPF